MFPAIDAGIPSLSCDSGAALRKTNRSQHASPSRIERRLSMGLIRTRTIDNLAEVRSTKATRTRASAPAADLLARLWVYQRERFPILAHGVLIGAFSLSAVSFSALLRGSETFPRWSSVAVAFLGAFFFFLQLRIADEFKDFEEDARWRPYRPVPRGLVSLRELAIVALASAVIQMSLAAALAWRLLLLNVLVWVYLALMTREFFVRDWIVKRPITYLWTHMLILPMVDFYATACDWAADRSTPPSGLFWFLAVSFFNGIALEIGRKVRAPEDEEEGVRTYSALWGRRKAVVAWLGALMVTGACAVIAADRINFLWPVTTMLAVLFGLAVWLGVSFGVRPRAGVARWIEHGSGIWTLILYLSLGVVPLLLRIQWGTQ